MKIGKLPSHYSITGPFFEWHVPVQCSSESIILQYRPQTLFSALIQLTSVRNWHQLTVRHSCFEQIMMSLNKFLKISNKCSTELFPLGNYSIPLQRFLTSWTINHNLITYLYQLRRAGWGLATVQRVWDSERTSRHWSQTWNLQSAERGIKRTAAYVVHITTWRKNLHELEVA